MSGSATTSPDHVFTAPSGAVLRLMPERSAWCPETDTLYVADLHLGKAATFRARGLPAPQGTTTETLQRLTAALRRSGAKELVVLGDLLHAKESHAPATLSALARWRESHPELRCQVVMGNHDRHAGTLDASLGFEVLADRHLGTHWIGVHESGDASCGSGPATPDPRLILAGHLHPVTWVSGRADRLRLPCFWLCGRVLTLPAFGAFTGGHRVDTPGSRAFLVADRVVEWRL